MTRSTVSRVFFLTIFLLGATADAQVPADLQTGTRIRVTVPNPDAAHTKRITGQLLNLTESEITLETSANKPPVVLPRESIVALEQSIAPGRRGQGALIGLGFGVLVGVVSGLASGDDAPGIVSLSAGEKAAVLAVAFAPVGALLGLVVSHGERWQTLDSNQVQLGFSPGPAGEPGFSLAFRF